MSAEEGMREAGSSPAGRAPFIADAMVAELARWLRILGEDCLWAPPDWSDDQVLQVAAEDARIVITRDDQLARRAAGRGLKAVRVPQREAEAALVVVYNETGLFPREDLLATRCSLCNGRLERLEGEEASRRAEAAGKEPIYPEVLRRHSGFWSCTVCHQPFWRGTHWDEIERVRARLLAMLGDEGGSRA